MQQDDNKSDKLPTTAPGPVFAQAAEVEFVDSLKQKIWDGFMLLVLTAWIIAAWVHACICFFPVSSFEEYLTFAFMLQILHPEIIAFPAFLYFCVLLKVVTKRISDETFYAPVHAIAKVIPSDKISNNVSGSYLLPS
ncbi:hypothetical protein BC828DRAFT_192714 [Blastocladiella britannica]|nr:hypothetical protein BC828DRAFT_192714 [Blastocladiella britannica]